jgi:hypothetical protein
MLKQIIVVTFLHFFLTIGSSAGATLDYGASGMPATMAKYAVEMTAASRYLSQPAFDLILYRLAETSIWTGPILMLNSLFWGILIVGVVRLFWLMWN